MASETDSSRHVTSLVQLCQRVAAAHVDNICSLGEGWRYDLIRPILESCDPETLQRLERASPYIEQDNEDIWKKLCFRTYPLTAELYEAEIREDTHCWRDAFFVIKTMEAQRLEELTARLRSQRQEEAERKSEKQIKITDKLPPVKRPRWGVSLPPKTLLQKTRSDAARLQKGIYGMRMVPPTMHRTKNYSVKSSVTPAQGSTSAQTPQTSSPATTSTNGLQGTRVTVSAVSVRRPVVAASRPSISSASPPPAAASPPAVAEVMPVVHAIPAPETPAISPLPAPERRERPPSRPSAKRDASSSLFMPKHRALSQLPTGGVRSRA